MRAALWRSNITVAPIGLTFLVDTGAERTTVNDQVFRSLGIDKYPSSQTRLVGVTSKGVPSVADVFDVQLEIVNYKSGGNFVVDPLAVTSWPLLNAGIEGLIGRDILNQVTLTYDGRNRRFEIAF